MRVWTTISQQYISKRMRHAPVDFESDRAAVAHLASTGYRQAAILRELYWKELRPYVIGCQSCPELPQIPAERNEATTAIRRVSPRSSWANVDGIPAAEFHAGIEYCKPCNIQSSDDVYMEPTQVRSARRKAGLSQQVAAARLGVSQPYYSQLKGGTRALPKALALRLVRHLGASPCVGPAVHGFLDHLRVGHGEQKPARVHGPVSGLSRYGPTALEFRLPAQYSPGNLNPEQRDDAGKTGAEYPERIVKRAGAGRAVGAVGPAEQARVARFLSQ